MTSQQGSENAIIDQIKISVSPTSSPENIHVYTHTHALPEQYNDGGQNAKVTNKVDHIAIKNKLFSTHYLKKGCPKQYNHYDMDIHRSRCNI
jgi:hypothetical protein